MFNTSFLQLIILVFLLFLLFGDFSKVRVNFFRIKNFFQDKEKKNI